MHLLGVCQSTRRVLLLYVDVQVPRVRSAMDKMVDYLLGDGPNNR